MRLSRLRPPLRAVAFCLVGFSAMAPTPDPPKAAIIDRIVAVVNDDIITWSELEDAAAPILRQVEALPDPVQRAQVREKQLRQALDQLVGRALIGQEALKRKLTVQSSEVDTHVEQVMRSQSWSPEQLKLYLQGQGITLATYRTQVKEQLLQRKVVLRVLGARIRVSDGDLEEYYKTWITQAKAEYELEAAHILLRVPEQPTPAEADAKRQQAESLLVRIKAGESFDDLARQYSDGPSAQNGGYLGTFRRGQLDPDFEKLAFELKPGTVGGPVRTQFGYHIIRSIARKALPTPPLDQVKNKLRMELTEKRQAKEMDKWVQELKARAWIEIRL